MARYALPGPHGHHPDPVTLMFRRNPWLALVGVLLLFAIPISIAWVGLSGRPHQISAAEAYGVYAPPSPPPTVEPAELRDVDPDTARSMNAEVPFSTDTNWPARPFKFIGSELDQARATDCLAAAVWYEAGDDKVGEEAVAQVVVNRVRHPAFPKTICGVIFQGSERRTGCQFTFTCDGAMTRTPSADAWKRAQAVARAALAGWIVRSVGMATHYHTDWVVPYWSSSLDKISAVDTHLFYRWKGWWGTPAAFHFNREGAEPAVPALARLSPAHVAAPGEAPVPVAQAMGDFEISARELAAQPAMALGQESVGQKVGAGRISGVQADGKAFLVALDKTAAPDSWQSLAIRVCAGRPQCRVMGWTDPGQAATRFPVDSASLPSMAYSYIQDAGTGLQRSLWNCDVFPRADVSQCMKGRGPAPTAADAAAAQAQAARARAVFKIHASDDGGPPQITSSDTARDLDKMLSDAAQPKPKAKAP